MGRSMIFSRLEMLKWRNWSMGACAMLGVLPGLAHAGLRNAIPSCYAAGHYRFKAQPPRHLLYVLIDQTVKLTPALQKSVVDTIDELIRPGTKIVVAEFSAYSQGRYLRVVKTGIVESAMTKHERNNVPVSSLGSFNNCMRDQMEYARMLFGKTTMGVMKNSTSSLDQSDILLALKTVSKPIRLATAKDKLLFMVSDGLENSSVTSFYGAGTVRRIDPAAQMRKVVAHRLLGNFGGGRVYVLGGAFMPPAASGSLAARNGYRDPQVLQALHEFWRLYFKKSDANLVEFGEPALVMRARW